MATWTEATDSSECYRVASQRHLRAGGQRLNAQGRSLPQASFSVERWSGHGQHSMRRSVTQGEAGHQAFTEGATVL